MTRTVESHTRFTLRKRLFVSLLSVVASFLVAELVVRIAGVSLLGGDADTVANCRQYLSRGTLLYQPFPYVGYIIEPRDAEDPTYPSTDWSFDLEREEGVLRVACLGGSTTYAGYPGPLAQGLEQTTGREFQVMNWGCPGWTTQETMVNYFVTVQSYEPDIVILHHAINDRRPRARPGFRDDYAHWRSSWRGLEMGAARRWSILYSDVLAAFFVRGDSLKLYRFVTRPLEESEAMAARAGLPTDAPAEGTARAFERNMRTIAESVRLRGGKVVLTTMPYNRKLAEEDADRSWSRIMDEHNQILRDLAEEQGYLLVDQAKALERMGADASASFVDRVHMTRKGQQWKAALLIEGMAAAGYLD
jgi:hypothetical protein